MTRAVSCVIVILAAWVPACMPLDDFVPPDCAEPGCGDGGDAAAGDDGEGDAPGDEDEDEGPPSTVEGCADGTREGFSSFAAYPAIAACAGAWSVGGVTRLDLVPTCDRNGGNDGLNAEGDGCSAADLCGIGWHVCRGQVEVAARASGGCAQAVPPGTPDKSVFYAIAQASLGDLTCEQADGDNDVFGCGNLGIDISHNTSCAPLNRAFGSSTPRWCGYNEAEPPYGPWQCMSTPDSHTHEGAVVTKFGCPAQSCSWNDQPVGNSDRGGVLCCRDRL